VRDEDGKECGVDASLLHAHEIDVARVESLAQIQVLLDQ